MVYVLFLVQQVHHNRTSRQGRSGGDSGSDSGGDSGDDSSPYISEIWP